MYSFGSALTGSAHTDSYAIASCSLSEKFIAERAKARGIECPEIVEHVRPYLLSRRREDERMNPYRKVRDV